MPIRIGERAEQNGVRVEHVQGAQYKVKDIWTTVGGDRETAPQWARQEYLIPGFHEAGGDHHLFVTCLDQHGISHLTNIQFFTWTPLYSGNDRVFSPNKQSGWANHPLFSGDSYSRERGESGPRAIRIEQNASDVVSGIGLRDRHHESTFVVFQFQKEISVDPPDEDEDYMTKLFELEKRIARVERFLDSW